MKLVTCVCPMCNKISYIECEEEAWKAYEEGALAQEAFPNMDLNTRETIISGMCKECQLFFFDDEDDDGCDGECDACGDFECPSNMCYFPYGDRE